MTRLEETFQAYVECALWSSTDEDGEPLDGLYSLGDIAPEALESMRADVVSFTDDFHASIMLSGLTPAQVGHDFWLTRNRHGAGFWDRGLGVVGDGLSDHAHGYGESDLYVGDDGRLYVSP